MSTSGPVTAYSAEPIDNIIGRRIHALMWAQRVKNKEIAELLGIDPTAVGKKLRAEQKFSVEQLSIIAPRLHTTISYLVGETSDPTRPDDRFRHVIDVKRVHSGRVTDIREWASRRAATA